VILRFSLNFQQSSRIQNYVQKLVAFLYTNNAQTEKEIGEIIPFTIAPKTINHLRINLTKEPKNFLMKTINQKRN
jgi:hypothetical protein